MGKEATALERKGVSTEKGNYNRTVSACNEMADLGIEPAGLWETAQEIFERARARQRQSKKARVSEPTLVGEEAAKAAGGRLSQPEVAKSGGPSGRSREDQRRTDAPFHGAVRQGAPCTPKKDESPVLSSEKKPQRRLETPPASAGGARQPAPDGTAPHRVENIRSAIRYAAGTHNFLATHGVESYADILVGVRKAQADHDACRDGIIHAQAEIDRLKAVGISEAQQLRELEKCALWCDQHRAVAEQFDKLKLFRGRFYQNHKDEIDKFAYASKKLQAAGYNDHVVPEAFGREIATLEDRQAEQIRALEARRDNLSAKWDDLREELRLWCSAELYMRRLLDLPDPEQPLPNFSAASGQEEDSIQAKLQRVSDLAHERKQRAPAKSHRRDDRGR